MRAPNRPALFCDSGHDMQTDSASAQVPNAGHRGPKQTFLYGCAIEVRLPEAGDAAFLLLIHAFGDLCDQLFAHRLENIRYATRYTLPIFKMRCRRFLRYLSYLRCLNYLRYLSYLRYLRNPNGVLLQRDFIKRILHLRFLDPQR